MMKDYTFLGRGWGFPPEFSRQSKSVVMAEDAEDIINSLQILLSTRIGERIMLPEFGCNLDEMLFNPLNLTLKTYITDLIKTAILYHERRIDVKKIDIDPTDEPNGVILIHIDFTIRTTNSRMNMVFPFYKEEGANL